MNKMNAYILSIHFFVSQDITSILLLEDFIYQTG